MVMLISGTFDYVAEIPVDWENSGGSCEARLTYLVKLSGRKLQDHRLVGHTPHMQIEDAGPTPNPGWDRGVWLPNILRSRIKLTAPSRHLASVASASFFVDTQVMSARQPGDLIHLSRSSSADLAISLIRGETLLMAAGDVTQVPLGKDLEARFPMKLTQALEGVFDPFEAADVLPEIPVERDGRDWPLRGLRDPRIPLSYARKGVMPCHFSQRQISIHRCERDSPTPGRRCDRNGGVVAVHPEISGLGPRRFQLRTFGSGGSVGVPAGACVWSRAFGVDVVSCLRSMAEIRGSGDIADQRLGGSWWVPRYRHWKRDLLISGRRQKLGVHQFRTADDGYSSTALKPATLRPG